MTEHLRTFWARFKAALPALAFFAGFLWDALTLGRTVQAFDLWTLAAYLLGAGGLLWWLAKRLHGPAAVEATAKVSGRLGEAKTWLQQDGPYFTLQFFFGGLFSALFIFYFKSSSHLSAYFVVFCLAILLVGNEFLEDHYGRFTLTWSLFGLCCMLFLNFAIPHLLGSLHPFWFYLSTILGAGLTHGLRQVSQGRPGRITPVWVLAGVLVLANFVDWIPPVPLVKRGLAMGHNLGRQSGEYRLEVEVSPWWKFWQSQSAVVHIEKGEKLFCVSSVFAPKGLQTMVYHRWLYHDPKKGWVTASRIGFTLSGGRNEGFRGYTYKQSLEYGEWKVRVETQDGRTVASHAFQVAAKTSPDTLKSQTWFL